jgi:hypothetical protein
MILLRTDGSGSFYNDERLRVVEKYLKYIYSEKLTDTIMKIHDHKGCLNVYWLIRPSKQDVFYIESIWNACCEYEVNHFLTKFNEFDPLLSNYEIKNIDL